MEDVALKGRGAIGNPLNRFETLVVERDEEVPAPERIETELLRDTSRSVIAYNDSPDVGFNASVNPYRGCEHGCVYCYARPSHEYLGFSAGLDFESRILVKEDAPELLRKELSAAKWAPQTAGDERRHRLLPAGRAPAGDHPPLPGGARRVPQPGRRHHQERAGDARHRHPPGAGRAPGRAS